MYIKYKQYLDRKCFIYEEYSIQRFLAIDASDVVALNIKTLIGGNYTIAVDFFDWLFATGQDFYLIGNNMGAERDLKAVAYNFTEASRVDNYILKFEILKSVENNWFRI